MSETKTPVAGEEDGRIYPGIRSFVLSDAEFREAVQAGIESAKSGPNRDLDVVAAEIRRSLTDR